jgi:hypothetical protein
MSLDNELDPLEQKQQNDLTEVAKSVALEGGRAKNHLASAEWTWFNNVVLKSLEDEAFETLKKANTDQERIKAQQMLLAADKPRQILKYLVRQGEAAEMQLRSTHQNGG